MYFEFEGMVYTAVISVRSTALLTEYTLNNFDEDLLTLLPGNKILSHLPGQFAFQDVSPQSSVPLMNAIIRAVAEHMHSVDVE